MPGKVNSKNKSAIPVKKDMPDYSNDPYFVEKAKKAEEHLRKWGLPKELQDELDKQKK